MLKEIYKHLFNQGEIRKIDTEFYPDPVSSRGKDDLPARARGLIFNEIEKCTACNECVKVCPTEAIELESQQRENVHRPWIGKFDIDFSRCIYCGFCVDVCDPNALIQTKEIQPAVLGPKDLKMNFGRGRR